MYRVGKQLIIGISGTRVKTASGRPGPCGKPEIHSTPLHSLPAHSELGAQATIYPADHRTS